LIEDNAQGSGALYKNKLAGTIGAIGTFSTVDGKIMSTGEGGFCLTNDDELAEKMGAIHNFYRAGASNYVYEFYGIGYNYRMTEFQAAIGREQLKKLDRMVKIRRKNANYLTARLRKIEGVSPPIEESWAKHVYYYYPLRINSGKLRVSRHQFENALTAEGIPVSPHRATPLINRTQLFAKRLGYAGTSYPFSFAQDLDYNAENYPIAEVVDKEVFWLTDALPILSRDDLDDIVTAVGKVATAYLLRAS
jgi:dTDP-4-amino-4,6-dideoxygalactose transaminase